MLAVYLVCMGALAGCKDDNFADWFGESDGIKIAYTIDGMVGEKGSNTLSSRSTDYTDIAPITSVHFVFFNMDGSYKCNVVAEGMANGSFSLPNTGLEEGQEYKTLIVANADNFRPDGFNTYSEYLESIKSDYNTMRNKVFCYGVPNVNSYPFAGEWVDGAGNISTFIHSDSKVNGTVRFKRMISRIDFENRVADKLIVEQIQVCNDMKGGYVFNENISSDPINRFAQNGIANIKDETKWLTVGAPVENRQLVNQAFYIFPNSVKRPEIDDDNTTCLLIKGRYNGKTAYFRFNICNNGFAQSMIANHVYRVVIDEVASEGAQTAELAYSQRLQITCESMNENGITIEAFDPVPSYVNTANDNGCIPSIPLELLGSSKVTKIQIESDFNNAIDLFLSTDANHWKSAKVDTEGTPVGSKNITFNSNSGCLYLNAFRTGPGDPDIHGSLRITTFNSENQFLETRIIPVTITTSCEIGDVLTNDGPWSGTGWRGTAYFIFPAHTFSGTKRIVGGKLTKPLNYSYNTKLPIIGGYKDAEYSENRKQWWNKYGYDGKPWSYEHWGSECNAINCTVWRNYGNWIYDNNRPDADRNMDANGAFGPWHKPSTEYGTYNWHKNDISYLWMTKIFYTKQRIAMIACNTNLENKYVVKYFRDRRTTHYVGCYIPNIAYKFELAIANSSYIFENGKYITCRETANGNDGRNGPVIRKLVRFISNAEFKANVQNAEDTQFDAFYQID